jgi:hypothetical protein
VLKKSKKKYGKLSFFERATPVLNKFWPQAIILSSLVVLSSFFFPRGEALKYSYQLNDIPREPIIAPFTFPILKSEEKLKTDLENALILEPFVFKRNTKFVQKWTNSLENFFLISEDIRKAKDKYLQSKDLVYRYRYDENYDIVLADFRADSIELSQLNLDIETQYSISINETSWASFFDVGYQTGPQHDLNEFENTIIQICRNRWAEGIYDIPKIDIKSDKTMIHQGEVPVLANTDEYHDLESAWIKAKQELTQSYSKKNEIQNTIGYDLIVEFMKPNLIYDKEVTERRQQSRLDRVPRFQGTILKDERIVDANERISEEVLLTLESLATAIGEKEGGKTGAQVFFSYFGRLIVIGSIISLAFTFLSVYRRPIFQQWKMIFLISLVFLTETVLVYLSVIQLGFSPYFLFLTVSAMTLTILFDARIGFMGTTSMAILNAVMIGNNLDFIIVGMTLSSMAMYNVRELRTRTQVFTTIFSLLFISVVVLIGLGLFKGNPWSTIWSDLLPLVITSILAPIITYGLIGILEIAFQITTDLTLIELLDFEHPLLKRLQQEANGTFNHSIVVGNLAEACANAIGARSLLCRVGAYYHDVGKMIRPEYFIENQYTGENKHDTLTYVMSAKTIKNHVKEGLELAREYKVPKIVRDFIPMHHGTTRVEYFYRKALENAEKPERVDKKVFQYPGPKPNTKETGILMLCEAIEAAVRSLKNPDIIKIEAMIDKIIKHRIDEGQMDRCPLTLSELKKIKGSVDGNTGMLPVLRGIYHIRIEYPDSETETGKVSTQS